MNRKRSSLRAAGAMTLVAALIVMSAAAQSIINTVIFTPAGVANNLGFDFEVAVVRDTGLVYVGATGAYGTEIGVIDPAADALVAVIDLGTPGLFNFALANQTTKLVYFRQPNSNIAVIDGRPSSATFNQALPPLFFPGHQVQSYALDETRGLLYVTHNNAGGPLQSRVSVIDADPSSATFHQVLNQVLLPANALARGVAVNAATNKIYLGLAGGAVGGVYVLDGASLSVAKIPGTVVSFGVIINESLNLVYATSGGNQLTAVDGATDTLLALIPVPGLVSAVAFDEKLALNRVTGRVYLQTSEDTPPAKVVVVDGDRLSPNFNTVLAAIPVGRASGAGDIVVDETLDRVVTTSFHDKRTSIIDGATNTVIATIGSTQIPSDAALDPATHRVFVANQENFVQEIDIGGASLTATIVTAAEVGQGVVNPNNHLFYVPRTVATTDVQQFDKCGGSATVAGLPHGSGRYVFSAINRNTNRIYAENSAANLSGDMISLPGFVSVIDGISNAVIANVEAGNQPFGIGINEATNNIYVSNAGLGSAFPGSITVIDGATNTTTAADTSAFPVEARFAGDIVANEATNKVYFQVMGGAPTTIGVLNGATNIATPLPASLGPISSIRINKVLNRVYVLSEATGLLHVLDGVTDAEIATLSIGSPATTVFGYGLAVNEQTGRVFVANTSDDTLVVIDGAGNTVVATLAVGDQPTEVAVNELANRAYVGSRDLSVSFVDGESLTVEATLALPLRPASLAVDAAVSRLYATSLNSDALGGVVVISDTDGTFDSLRQAIIAATVGDPPGIRNSMLSKVDNAAADLARGKTQSAINKLQALENQVEAQRGKRLTEAEADLIRSLISAVINSVC